MVLAAFMLAFALVDFLRAETPDAVDLIGHVLLPRGNPARAVVLISYAQLKTNLESSIYQRSPLLPRHVQTDNRGNFRMKSFDSRYLYFGYVAAPGCKLQEFYNVDPAAGPATVSLEGINLTNLPPDQILHGRVVDQQGRPISNALITVSGSTRNGQMTWPAYDVDYFSVSDDAGNFVICGKTPFAAIDGAVEADGFAKSSFEQWPSDEVNREMAVRDPVSAGAAAYAHPMHEMTLTQGGSLRGRLLNDGKPVVNAEVRLNGCGVGSHCWFREGAVLTDHEGRFLFEHLPAGQSYSIRGTWDLLAAAGAFPAQDVKTQNEGSTTDVGDLNLQPVSEVNGHIKLSDGEPLPANSRFLLSDDAMGSSSSSAIGKTGSFHFTAVPGDAVWIYLRVPGYQLTPRDPFLKSGTVTNITVARNMTNFVITMKPESLTTTIAYFLRDILR